MDNNTYAMRPGQGRLTSLDALRGFDMFFIMGGAGLLAALAKWFPCSFTEELAHQMGHVEWHGLTHHDTIFPLFLFIAGISFPFSLSKQRAAGRSEGSIHWKVVSRGLILVLLGMIYNGLLGLNFEDFRYASVLGKIVIAWMVAALWYVHFGVKSRLSICVLTLVGYWALLQMTAPDAPAGCGPFTPEGCFPGYLDRLGFTPGKLYVAGLLEPSGLPVSFFGSATAMMGMFAGDLLRSGRTSLTASRKALCLASIGLVAGLAGWGVSFSCPIVKKLWTPSFMLVVGGYSFVILALFYWIIDVLHHDRWSFFLQVVGVNSIAIYMLKRIVGYKQISQFLFGGVASWFPDPGFVESLGIVVLCWLTCWFLNRHRIYLKV